MAEKVIMVVSGKGGTGKSTTSVYLAAGLAANDKKVLLIELDTALRSVDIISGVYGKTVYDISDILGGKCETHKAILESPLYKNVWVVSAPYEGEDAISKQSLEMFCDKVKDTFDYIVIDTAAGIGDAFTAAKSVSDLALIVITPDPIALRDGRIVSDNLYKNDYNNFRLIINKVKHKNIKKSELINLDECIDTVCAQLIGVIPESDDIHNCGTKGKKLPRNTQAWKVYQNIAARILGEDVSLEMY